MTTCPCGMPSFGYPECYWHAKAHVDWSTRPPASNGLSPKQRAFIGLFDRSRPRDGWRSADGWVRSLDPDPEVDLERTAMLRFLAAMGDMDELPSV
jgi:hypothetical protein